MKTRFILILLAALWVLPAAAQVYVTPGTSTMPKVDGTGVQLLTTIYPATANRLYLDRVKPGLDCLRPDGTPYYNPDACDELAAFLLAGGVDKVVIDWEQTDTEANRRAYLRIAWRFQDRGVRVLYYGGDPAADRFYVAFSSGNEVHAVFYQYTLDADLWIRQRTEALAKVRAAWPDRKIVVWLCPFHSADGDGPDNPPIPAGQFVGKVMWARQLAWCKLHKLDVVVWIAAFTPAGGYAPFDEQAEWWLMLQEWAKSRVK